jgi:hypothetical protein
LDEAEPFYRRALAIDEQGLGPNHPRVASHLSNLAQLLQAINLNLPRFGGHGNSK